eukprot:SAG22_NODE_13805_length_394_cov_0.871186_1_plen_27_part_01
MLIRRSISQVKPNWSDLRNGPANQIDV